MFGLNNKLLCTGIFDYEKNLIGLDVCYDPQDGIFVDFSVHFLKLNDFASLEGDYLYIANLVFKVLELDMFKNIYHTVFVGEMVADVY